MTRHSRLDPVLSLLKKLISACLLLSAAFSTRGVAQTQDLKLDSGGAYLTIGNALELRPRFAFTIEAWVRYNSSINWGGTGAFIYSTAPYSSWAPILLSVKTGTREVVLVLKTETTDTSLVSSAPITDFGWTHVAATWDGTTAKIFLNGVAAGSTPVSGPLIASSGASLIGGFWNSSNSSWMGRIDEFRIWNHARSSSEITERMYEQLDHAQGLVGAWHFNGNFADETGGNNASAFSNCSLVASTSPVNPLQLVAPGRAQVNSTIDFLLRGAPPGAPYFLDNSFTGTSAGTQLTAPLSGVFPLNSPLLNLTYGPLAPGIFVDYMGFTDTAGEANAAFHVPNFSHLLGLQMDSAFLYLSSLNPMILGEISQVISTEIRDPAPLVTSLFPISGPLSQSWPVSISGQNFQNVPQVLVDGLAATNVVVNSSTLISCDFPAGTSLKDKDVILLFPGEDPIYLESAYTYLKDLVITSMTPTFANPGDSVVMYADGVEVGATIEVAGIPAGISSMTINTNNSATIVFIMPTGAPCHAPVVLRNPDGRNDVTVINPGPFIAATIGNQGPTSGGTTFYIVGSNFDSGVQVSVGGVPATLVSSSVTTLAVVSPAGPLGSASVVVTNGDGCTVTTSFLYQ